VTALRIAIALAGGAAALAAAPYRIAVVSMSHSHAGGHLERMLKSDAVTLVGVGENAPDLVARARKLGVRDDLIFPDWRQMIDRVQPDVVWAFTETNRHVEVVEYCAPRKVHVMVEKPLSATHAEALAIERAATRHGIRVFTNYSTAWQPAVYAARAALAAGHIGSVTRMRVAIGHMGPGDPRKSAFAAWLADPIKNGGGALMDFGCYGVLQSLWYKGRPDSVLATANQLRPDEFPKVEDHAVILLHYQDGVAILEASWNLPARPASGFEIFGQKGSLNVGATIELRLNAGGRAAAATSLPVDPLPPERADALAYMGERLRANQPLEGLVALPINVMLAEILDAAKESVRTGRVVKLAAK
jgi:predicted dehydrogenase